MPATITSVQATRTCSVKPAQGLRYGNFDGVRNLPPIRYKEGDKKENLCLMNNEQICRRICQWMETWQPWQTRTLLCGIANRFTVGQLEILATTLEPLRHRDYKTETLSRYPSASLRVKNSPSPISKKKSKGPKPEKASRFKKTLVTTDTQAIVSSESKPRIDSPIKRRSKDRKKNPSMQTDPQQDTLIQTDENNNSNEEKKIENEESQIQEILAKDEVLEPDCVNDQELPMNINHYSSVLSFSILKSAVDEANTAILYDDSQFSTSKETCLDNEDNKTDAESDKRTDDLEKNGIKKIPTKQKQKIIEKISEEIIFSNDDDNGNQEFSKSFVYEKSYPKSATSVPKSIPQSSRASSTRFLGGILEFATDPYQRKHVRSQSTSSRFRYSVFASSAISTSDFFNKQKLSIFGAMQQAMHLGSLEKPVGLDLAPVSLQKCYKNSRWWPPQAPLGKTYYPPQKQELANNFKEQLQTIWEWLKDWEGYERISFMKEVLKKCSADILDSLMIHIHQRLFQNVGTRLQDVRDINRLPDELMLYILSFLPSSDILQCAKVCRRWRYLCARDDLWILKCLEIGEQVGISNLAELIESARGNGLQVDWMLAHFELNKLMESLNIEWAQDDVDRLPGQFLKYDRIWTGIIRPFAGELSEKEVELERGDKKAKGTVRIQLNTGIKEKLEMAEKARQVGRSSTHGDGDASDTDSAFSEEDLSHLMAEYNMMPEPSTSAGQPQLSKALKKSESFKLAVPEIVREETTPGASSTNRLTRSSKRSSASSSSKKTKMKKDNKSDVALDIRTNLTQSHDILGKMKSYSSLEWETMDTYSDYMRTTLYAGELVGVKRMRKLQGHLGGINCVYFDKRRLVTCGRDRIVWLWDVRSGRSLHQFVGHKGGIRCLQFDNDILATGSWDCLILVWDIKKFNLIATLQGHSDSVTCLQFNGDLLISGSDDFTVRLWRRPTFYCMLTITFDATIQSLIIIDHLFVVTTADLTTDMIDVYTGTRRRKFEPPLSPVQCLTAHGQLLIGGDSYGRVCFWNLTSGEMEAAVKVHDAAVNQVAYHNGRFFTASDDTTIKEWDLRTMTCLRVLKGHRGPVRDVKVSDRRIVSCSDDTSVRIWDLVLDKTKVLESKA